MFFISMVIFGQVGPILGQNMLSNFFFFFWTINFLILSFILRERYHCSKHFKPIYSGKGGINMLKIEFLSAQLSIYAGPISQNEHAYKKNMYVIQRAPVQ